MPDYSLPSRVVSSDELMEAISNLSESPRDLPRDEFNEAIDAHDPDGIVLIGTQLGLMEEDNGDYRVPDELIADIRHASDSQKSLLLRKHLLRFSPFTSFITFLIQEDNSEDAARRANVFYQLGISEDIVAEQFLGMAEYAGMITRSADGISFEFPFEREIISTQYASVVANHLHSEIAARLFIENRLGEGPVEFMDDESFEELIAALVLFDDSPRSSIAAAGRAVEDFLRDIASEYGNPGTNYSDANGIGGVTQRLNGDSLLKKRHFHGGNYLSGMRNPGGGHGKDVDTLDRWSVSPEVALGYIFSTIHFIRSVFEFVENDAQNL